MTTPNTLPANVEFAGDRPLLRADHPEWDRARIAWNLAIDQRPAAVVEAFSVDDVVAAVGMARTHGLGVVPQATGHHASVLGDLSGCFLLRTGGLSAVEIDVSARTARVGAGVIWADLTAAAAEHGLTGLAGSSPDVGVVAYAMGGGHSWFARSHGPASDDILAARVVTGAGDVLDVDADHAPELFWALRGAGTRAGVVVTELTLRLHQIDEVVAGMVMYDLDHAGSLLSTFAEWVDTLPDTVQACARLLRFPPMPDLPDFLRGRSFAAVDAVLQMSPAEADAVLAPLRALEPHTDTFAPTPPSALGALHMDPPGPVPGLGDGRCLEDLTPGAIDAILAAAGPAAEDCALLLVDVRALGGALARGTAESTALGAVAGKYAMFTTGIAPFPQAAAVVMAQVGSLVDSLEPWRAARDLTNFRETPGGDAEFVADAGRLAAVRAAYDPDGVIYTWWR